jgi:hypothetical protein
LEIHISWRLTQQCTGLDRNDPRLTPKSLCRWRRSGGTTELCTFHLGNLGVNGLNNQQSGVRYTLDGMAFGMIERSSPTELCTIIG